MADKTYVPGLEDDNAVRKPEAKHDLTSPKRDFHSIPTASSKEGTVVPGLEDEDAPSRGRTAISITRGTANKNKPIVGFLYSVSKSSFGEFWPLYLGPNSIGASTGQDIVLDEATVSGEHALITIHKDEDPEEIFAVLEDTHSTNGIKLNGKSIRFERVECKHMDVIRIGKSYELLLLLIDTGTLGLKPADNFVPIERSSSQGINGKRIISREGSFTGPSSSANDMKRRLSSPSSERTRSADFDDEDAGGTRIK